MGRFGLVRSAWQTHPIAVSKEESQPAILIICLEKSDKNRALI